MSHSIVRLMLAIVTFAAACCSIPAQAQSGSVGAPLSVCVARATPGTTISGLFAGAVKTTCTDKQYRLGPGDYWVLSQPVSAGGEHHRHLHVRMTSVWQKSVTLYALYTDGKVARMHVDSHGLTRHIQLGAIVDFQLPPRPQQVTRLAWRIEGSANARGIVLDPRLATMEQAATANLTMAAVYSGFGGLALALFVYNFALWGAMRHRFQIFYCLMVLSLAAYAFSSSGALAWAFQGIDNNDRLRTNYVTLGITSAFVIAFARSFFEPRVFAGWLNRYAVCAIALLVCAGPGFAILSAFDMPLADTLFSYACITALFITPAILWRAWRQRSDYRWLFAMAWAIPILFAAWRLLATQHLVIAGTGFWLDNSTIISMAFEAIVSSLAIAYRVQMLRNERDDAVAGEVIARHQADTDPLTGLLNRRSFLAQAIGRSGEQTLHVIDIDHFKLINETLGHDGGDEVLRVYARILRTLIPAGALLARIGGEEFAIITTIDMPIDPERVLAKLRAARMPFDLSVTSSIGTCTGPLQTEIDWKKLYHNADRALFEAKSAGRDRARKGIPLAAAA